MFHPLVPNSDWPEISNAHAASARTDAKPTVEVRWLPNEIAGPQARNTAGPSHPRMCAPSSLHCPVHGALEVSGRAVRRSAAAPSCVPPPSQHSRDGQQRHSFHQKQEQAAEEHFATLSRCYR
mmetsp:Transcript_39333/g.109393  ORF Transcript_39333/g.109393 Transcript_39333/m.109393 type:complete len:123 (-) Transcript_39333:448-816(-)